MKIKPLSWSEPSGPNSLCRYDHVIAETAFGNIYITWKSWKDYPDYTVEFPFEWSKDYFHDSYMGYDTLDTAKLSAEACWTDCIRSAINLTHSASTRRTL